MDGQPFGGLRHGRLVATLPKDLFKRAWGHAEGCRGLQPWRREETDRKNEADDSAESRALCAPRAAWAGPEAVETPSGGETDVGPSEVGAERSARVPAEARAASADVGSWGRGAGDGLEERTRDSIYSKLLQPRDLRPRAGQGRADGHPGGLQG